jgi:poly-gamma-glutamate capsule biosynthesis protein CapA/YwtB (metallophosphatase superfamily)
MERRKFLSRAAKVALAAAASGWTKRAGAAVGRPITLAAVGDCLITRGFDRQNSGLQPLLSILREADVTFGNFEMTLPDPGMYPAATGGCGDLNNSAEGPMPEELHWAGFKIMGLANNHALDYGVDGMFATAKKVARAGIVPAGTGRNLQDARSPAYYDSPAGRAALIACASTIRAGSLATEGNGEIPGRPGLNPLRVRTTYQVDGSQLAALQKIHQDLFPGRSQNLIEPPKREGINFLGNQFVAGASADVITASDPRDLAGIIASVRRARRNADLVLVGIHAHEAHGDREIPATFLPEFAHACIDAGAHAFIGHGPHVLRGIEVYKGKPIFYSLGNFIFTAEGMRQIPREIYDTCGIAGDDPSDFFDRAMKGFTDDVYWQSVVAQATFIHDDLTELKLHPIDLQPSLPRAERGIPVRADFTQSRAILDRLATLSEPFGTRITQERGVGIVHLTAG